MAFSGKTIKYRVGDKIDSCSLYNVETDVLENDIAIPVTIDNTTMYLIGVHPSNEQLYTLSSLTHEQDGSVYTIAKSKFKSKVFDFFYSGSKFDSLTAAHENMFGVCMDNISSGGHSDHMIVSKTSTGIKIEFNNVYDSFVDNYLVIGSGGSGGYGGKATRVLDSCSVAHIYYGGGGGGGEAGEKHSKTTPTRADILYCDYTSSYGHVNFKSLLGSNPVINVSATYGANGANAVNTIRGTGGQGRTNQANGSSGSNGGEGREGAGGTGGYIVETGAGDLRFGYGGIGGVGSNKQDSANRGANGGPWLIKFRLLYYV